MGARGASGLRVVLAGSFPAGHAAQGFKLAGAAYRRVPDQVGVANGPGALTAHDAA
jgi:hypothetical protein